MKVGGFVLAAATTLAAVPVLARGGHGVGTSSDGKVALDEITAAHTARRPWQHTGKRGH